jgi:MFS family permease
VWAALRSPYSILFWLAFGATFGGSAMFSMLGYYFIDRLAGSPTQVGLAFTLLGLAGVALQFGLVGPLIRRWGEVAVTCAGLLVGAIGFAVTAASATATVVIACVVLIGIGMALVRPAITSLLSKRAEQGLGLAMGVQSAFDSLGRTVGPLWAGMIYAVDIRAPFASSSAVFLLFFLATLGAARRVRPAPQTAGR